MKDLNRHHGQGMLATITVVVVAALLIIGLSTSQMASMNAQRIAAGERSLEALYCAKAGISQAMATRMMPRNNRSVLESYGASPSNSSELSGKCMANGNNLSGLYKYFIVGGDLGSLPLKEISSSDTASPFYVASQGGVCRDPKTKQLGFNQIRYPKGGDFSCQAPYVLEKVTLLSKIQMGELINGKVEGTGRVLNTQQVSDPEALPLSELSKIPCNTGVFGKNSFNSIYNCNEVPLLQEVHVYKLPNTGADKLTNPLGGNTVRFEVNRNTGPFSATEPTPLDERQLIIGLFFNHPVDYRNMTVPDRVRPPTDPSVADVDLALLDMTKNLTIPLLVYPSLPSSQGIFLVPSAPIPLSEGNYRLVINKFCGYGNHCFSDRLNNISLNFQLGAVRTVNDPPPITGDCLIPPCLLIPHVIPPRGGGIGENISYTSTCTPSNGGPPASCTTVVEGGSGNDGDCQAFFDCIDDNICALGGGCIGPDQRGY